MLGNSQLFNLWQSMIRKLTYSHGDEEVKKMQYQEQWKIRVTFIGPGVLCTSCKGRGSLNLYRPDVFTLKVKEIEKDDNCTFIPFPSSTYFFNPPQQFACKIPYFDKYNYFHLNWWERQWKKNMGVKFNLRQSGNTVCNIRYNAVVKEMHSRARTMRTIMHVDFTKIKTFHWN